MAFPVGKSGGVGKKEARSGRAEGEEGFECDSRRIRARCSRGAWGGPLARGERRGPLGSRRAPPPTPSAGAQAPHNLLTPKGSGIEKRKSPRGTGTAKVSRERIRLPSSGFPSSSPAPFPSPSSSPLPSRASLCPTGRSRS